MMHAVEPPSVSEKPHGDGPGGRGRASASETGASRRNMRNTRSMTMNVSVIAPWITALLNGAACLPSTPSASVGRRKEEAARRRPWVVSFLFVTELQSLSLKMFRNIGPNKFVYQKRSAFASVYV